MTLKEEQVLDNSMGNCFTCLKSTSSQSSDNEASGGQHKSSAGGGEPISEKKISHGKTREKNSCLIKFKIILQNKKKMITVPQHTQAHHIIIRPQRSFAIA